MDKFEKDLKIEPTELVMSEGMSKGAGKEDTLFSKWSNWVVGGAIYCSHVLRWSRREREYSSSVLGMRFKSESMGLPSGDTKEAIVCEARVQKTGKIWGVAGTWLDWGRSGQAFWAPAHLTAPEPHSDPWR